MVAQFVQILFLLQVDEYMYELTVDSIHEIFKGYGEVRKIAIFQKNNQWQALVQYPDHQVRCSHPQCAVFCVLT